VGQLPQLVDGQPQLMVGLIDQADESRARGRAELRAGESEREGKPDEPLLGAVVQVRLQPPPFGVSARDDPGLCGLQVLELGQHLGVEPLVFHAEPGSGRDILDQAGVVQQASPVPQDRHGPPAARQRRECFTAARPDAGRLPVRAHIAGWLSHGIGELEAGVTQDPGENVRSPPGGGD